MDRASETDGGGTSSPGVYLAGRRKLLNDQVQAFIASVLLETKTHYI